MISCFACDNLKRFTEVLYLFLAWLLKLFFYWFTFIKYVYFAVFTKQTEKERIRLLQLILIKKKK